MKKPFPKKSFFTGLVILLIICGSLIILELTNAINLVSRGNKSQESTIPSTSPSGNESSKNTNTDKVDNSVSDNPTDKVVSPVASGGPLVAPSGNFVSTHHITLNDPIFANLESVCVTTPGAKCSITFKKGNETKLLESRTADTNGSITWNWNPNTASLTKGTWQIIATAENGVDSRSTTDLQNLEVSE